MICIGHRGAMGYRPENTLASFELALEMGCPWVELDVYSVEDELIVIHDDKLDRTTDGHGRVETSTVDYIRSLDAGEGQCVPFLREVIDLVDHRAGINIELKGPNTAGPVSRLLNEYCSRGWDSEEFLLSSFSHSELMLADPTFRRGALFGRRNSRDSYQVAEALSAWSINLDLSMVTTTLVEGAHQRGLKVLVYTVNEPDDMQRMVDLSVDGVFTNYPDRLFKLLDANK